MGIPLGKERLTIQLKVNASHYEFPPAITTYSDKNMSEGHCKDHVIAGLTKFTESIFHTSVFARSLPHFLSGFMSAISLAILLKVLETGSAYSSITYSSKRTLTTFVLTLEKYLVFVRQYYRG